MIVYGIFVKSILVAIFFSYRYKVFLSVFVLHMAEFLRVQERESDVAYHSLCHLPQTTACHNLTQV